MTFVIGTLAVTSAVVATGWYSGVSAGMLVLMAVTTLVIGQIMYVVMLVGMAWLLSRREKAAERERNPAQKTVIHSPNAERGKEKTATGQSLESKR